MSIQTIERTTLTNLIWDEDYARKVIPFIKPEYYSDKNERVIFEEITKFTEKYNAIPTQEALTIELDNRKDVNDDEYRKIVDIISSLQKSDVDTQWLLDTTEKFCKDKAIYNAVVEGIGIIDGKDKERTPEAIPSILSEALAVSFDTNIGHDYVEDGSERFDFYHKKEEKIAFDLEYFNKITKGGVPSKTLNICLAGRGVGKSLVMCHLAASALSEGRNVLYISLEMAEERIAERIDANLLNVPIDQLENLSKDMFTEKVAKLARKTNGKLIIKEYPTGSAHAGHFRALLNELKLKKQFEPDVIFIDYLNICASSRMKGMGGAINSYNYVKAIAEELRGLAVEYDVPLWSATQTTRSGYSNSDVGLEDTSESFGLPATADLMFALISTEELEGLGQIMVKQLKNRYNDPTFNKRFVIGVDRGKMRLSDVDETEQDLTDDTPVFDKGEMSERFKEFKL